MKAVGEFIRPWCERFLTFSPETTMMVGLRERTFSGDGLKIIPHLVVGFQIGDATFDIPVDWARDLAGRLVEFCDHAEKPV